MTDPIGFISVEKQHLIRLSDHILAGDVANENAAIRKHEVRFIDTLVIDRLGDQPLAAHVVDCDTGCVEQRSRSHFFCYGVVRHRVPMLNDQLKIVEAATSSDMFNCIHLSQERCKGERHGSKDLCSVRLCAGRSPS